MVLECISLLIASIELIIRTIKFSDDILSISEDKQIARLSLQDISDWISDVRDAQNRLQHFLPQHKKARLDTAISDTEQLIQKSQRFIDGSLAGCNNVTTGQSSTNSPVDTFGGALRWVVVDNKRVLRYQSLLEQKRTTLMHFHTELENIRRECGLPLNDDVEAPKNLCPRAQMEDEHLPPPSYDDSMKTSDTFPESRRILVKRSSLEKFEQRRTRTKNRWETRVYKGCTEGTREKMVQEARSRREEQERMVSKLQAQKPRRNTDYLQKEVMARLTENMGGLCC